MASPRCRRTVRTILFLLVCWILPAGSSHAIETQSQWDKAFRSACPDRDPGLEDPGNFPGEAFAWQGHYWIRAYVAMADAYGDKKYLDKAVVLIDHMLNHRDDARSSRGELDVRAAPYGTAPLHYLNHRGEAAPGWRKYWNGEIRVDVVTDGMITQAIMRFVDLVIHSPRFPGYRAKAGTYLSRVEETVAAWDDSFAYGRDNVPGSWWYPTKRGTGLSGTEVPFNQSAAMASTLLLLDKAKGGVPEYRKKAGAVLDFWRMKRRSVSGDTCYEWNYYLLHKEYGVEDTTHSHIDMSFFNIAFQRGLMTDEEMNRLANTFTGKIYKGDGNVAGYVDGSGSGDGFNAGFDWIDLARVNPGILDIAREVYTRHYLKPTWARPFLGWAEILRWKAGKGLLRGGRLRRVVGMKRQVGEKEQAPADIIRAEQGRLREVQDQHADHDPAPIIRFPSGPQISEVMDHHREEDRKADDAGFVQDVQIPLVGMVYLPFKIVKK